MASKVSREAIGMMRAILGEGPSEAELIRCLYMARSDVALAINHYMDSASTSYARVPPPRRTSGPPPAEEAKADPPRTGEQDERAQIGGNAEGQTEVYPETPGRGVVDGEMEREEWGGGEGEELDGNLGSGPLSSSHPEANARAQRLSGDTDHSIPDPAAGQALPAGEPFREPAEVRMPVVDISQHRPRLPSKPAHPGGSVRTPIDVGPDTELPAPFLARAKKQNQRRGGSGEWWLLRETQVVGYSTTKGRKLGPGDEVTFAFPKQGGSKAEKKKLPFRGGKPAGQSMEIVRFSTSRAGEVGRLPGDLAKCLIPLVGEGKVKVEGQCIAAPDALTMMCNVDLSIRIYVSRSLFTKPGTGPSANANSALSETTTGHPFSSLLEQLDMRPFQRAQFTPEDFFTRKRALALEGDGNENRPKRACVAGQTAVPVLNGAEAGTEEAEVVLDDKEVDRLVGSSDMEGLEEMEPAPEMLSKLRAYQKQALWWMSNLESGDGLEDAEKTLHPCWEAYKLSDRRTPFYHNVFSGEVTLDFPSALTTARGGILADAMGLGKTVMTISLIVTNRGRGGDTLTDAARPAGDAFGGANEAGGASPLHDENLEGGTDAARLQSHQQAGPLSPPPLESTKVHPLESRRKRARRGGGTLIVCPMTLLSQWKAEVEAHVAPRALSVYCYYGTDRARERRVLTSADVVITTYGVLASECGQENFLEDGPVHSVHWFRVVLDEAHSIKASKTHSAKGVFHLTADRRWCLTGTPIQNKLEDIFSLLHFLRVEPWANWGWWNKLIQRPYEEGDERSLKLLQAILKPLMLRRTKDTTDKDGNPILVLPPADMAVVECEFNAEERDFYDALYTKSKRKFDSFVEAGKVLHNYASILELLLRLRQCCDHPFLVLSRGDTSDYSDLDKLATRFLKGPPKPRNPPRSPSPIPTNGPEGSPEPEAAAVNRPSKAYITNLLEELKAKGGKVECPICIDSAEDGVLTPCGHAMCRECLFNCWRSPAGGLCPVCRQPVQRPELITLPSDSRFQIDVEAQWQESAKVRALFAHLEELRPRGEKSIVFSQWTAFLDLLEIPLKRRKFVYVRLDGTLSQPQREKAIKDFTDRPDVGVMLISLKAGGVGINLTAASNAFLLDPWWNPAVEEQAIMRVHRIGQTKNVTIRRFIVKGSVEERMQQVQARKQKMVNGALTDQEMKSARIEDLKMLFR